MKKILLISLMSLLVLSCKKEEETNVGNNSEGNSGNGSNQVDTDLKLNSASYTIDGTTYEISSLTWTEFSVDNYVIDGTGNNNEELTIGLPSIDVDTYTFNDPKISGDDIDVRITTTNSIFGSVHQNGTIKIIESTSTYVLGEFNGKFDDKTFVLPASGEFYIEIK